MIVPPAVKADTFGGRAARAWRHSAPAEIWQPKVDVSVVFHQRRLYVEALEHLVNFQALDPQPPVVGLGNPKQPPLLSKVLMSLLLEPCMHRPKQNQVGCSL